MSLEHGARWAKNKGTRVRAAINAPPDVSKTQENICGESGGFRNQCQWLRALPIE